MQTNDPFMKPFRWALGALLALSVLSGTAQAGDEEQILTLSLSGGEAEPFAHGTLEYRVRPDQTSIEIEVEDLRNTASVEFFVDGASLGVAPVTLGQANVEVESESGPVPVVTAESVVAVTNAATGDVVVTNGDFVGSEGDDNSSEAESSSEGADDNGGEAEVEGDDSEGADDNGGEAESEGDDSEGADDNGGEAESEGDDSEGDNSIEGSNDDDDEIEVEIVLTGTANDPGAVGKAELKNDNERRRIEVEVHGVTAAARVSVLVDGVNVGTGRVVEGEAEVKRDEREDYTIPVISDASRVDVINSETGDILLSSEDVVIAEGEGEGVSSEGEGASEGEGSSEGEVQPAPDGIVLKQKLGPNGTYVPGETTVIEARMSYEGTTPVLALSIEQTLPAGWTFVRSVDAMGAFLQPKEGDTGTITWAWIAVPQLPAVLSYEVAVPADAAGVQTLEGSVLYRRMGGAEYAIASLDAPAGEGFTRDYCHTTDSNDSWTVELGEVLRTIQMYNIGAYHCSDGTEDGYAPGVGDDSCLVQDADQLNPDWRLDLAELLRIIQFYNAEDSAYLVGEGTEDGFLPGVFSLNN